MGQRRAGQQQQQQQPHCNPGREAAGSGGGVGVHCFAGGLQQPLLRECGRCCRAGHCDRQGSQVQRVQDSVLLQPPLPAPELAQAQGGVQGAGSFRQPPCRVSLSLARELSCSCCSTSQCLLAGQYQKHMAACMAAFSSKAAALLIIVPSVQLAHVLVPDKWHQCIPTAAHPADMPRRVHWRLQWTFAVRVFVECGSLQCPWLVSNQILVDAVCLLITAIVTPVDSRAYTAVQCSSTPTLACASPSPSLRPWRISCSCVPCCCHPGPGCNNVWFELQVVCKDLIGTVCTHTSVVYSCEITSSRSAVQWKCMS